MDMDDEIRATIEAQLVKKKPPKLKTVDRTMSLALDNYSPGNAAAGNSAAASGLAIDPSLLLTDELMMTSTGPPPPTIASTSSTLQELQKQNIFYMETSNNSISNYTDYPHPHTHHLPRKPSIRRSDTLDIYGPGMYDIRKTHSFNSNEGTVEDMLLARRTSSMRHTPGDYDQGFIDDTPLPPPAPPIVTQAATSRRNCRMHKSFHERRHEPKKEVAIETVKCHSLGDDGSDDNVNSKRKLSPNFNSANSSLENEVFHTRGNSGNREVEAEPVQVIEITPTMQPAKKTSGTSHKHGSHSLDKQHNFRRIARATQSFYLNPNHLEQMRLQRAMQGASGRKMHSASMRAKPFRETLNETKKSKSFVTDPFGEYELSPHRRNSKHFTGDIANIAELKKSPRMSSNLMLPENIRSSHESRKSSNFDGNDLDYDVIMRAYRQNRRKSSIVSAGKKSKGSTKKKQADDSGDDGVGDDDDIDSESTRKRKRIVCFIVTVFLSLVFASVFVVVFTLTHSTVTQVHNQTKKVYTFVRDRDIPIHYNGKNSIYFTITLILSY